MYFVCCIWYLDVYNKLVVTTLREVFSYMFATYHQTQTVKILESVSIIPHSKTIEKSHTSCPYAASYPRRGPCKLVHRKEHVWSSEHAQPPYFYLIVRRCNEANAETLCIFPRLFHWSRNVDIAPMSPACSPGSWSGKRWPFLIKE